jgi:hypothetical protein
VPSTVIQNFRSDDNKVLNLRRRNDTLEFHPGPNGNKNAKTCRIIGDSSPSSMLSFTALNFRTAAPENFQD